MRVVYHPAAVVEVVEATQFYDAQLAGLGLDFLGEVDRAVEAIIKEPLRYAIVRGNMRRCSLKRFPYGLDYRQVRSELRILVLKHHHRHPAYGLRRN